MEDYRYTLHEGFLLDPVKERKKRLQGKTAGFEEPLTLEANVGTRAIQLYVFIYEAGILSFEKQ